MDCFIPKFKTEYDNLENIKTDRVNAVIFNLDQIKRLKYFLGDPVAAVRVRINAIRFIFFETDVRSLEIRIIFVT